MKRNDVATSRPFATPQRTVKNTKRLFLSIEWFVFVFVLLSSAGACFGGGWYVGNTAPGEWIQFTNVWLTAGSYRFTANAGSPSDGALMHLEIDGAILRPGVAVPNTGRADTFTPVNLGCVSLSQGGHTLRAVFETSG